jgi:K+-sensing histidine kinase KdpD
MDEHSVRHKSLRVLWPSATLFLLANIGLALLTAVCFRLRLNLATVALLYLIVVVLLSLKGSFVASAVVCVVAVLCLEYLLRPFSLSGCPTR